MVSKKVTVFLEKHGVPYVVVDHRKVYTAYDAAQTLRLKLNQIMKSLLVKVDKKYYLVSVPADKNIDFALLKKAVKAVHGTVTKIEIPNEKTIAKAFNIKPGALTSFGKFHGVQTVVDKDLKKIKELIVSGGSLTQSLKMKIADYLKVEEPVVALIGKKKKLSTPQNVQPKKKPTKLKKATSKKSKSARRRR